MLVEVNSVLAVVFIAVTVLVGKFGGGFAAFVVNDGVCVVVLAVVISVSYEFRCPTTVISVSYSGFWEWIHDYNSTSSSTSRNRNEWIELCDNSVLRTSISLQ